MAPICIHFNNKKRYYCLIDNAEFFCCCFSDYADGSPSTDPRGPPGGWFQTVWERDFPILKGLTIQLNPTSFMSFPQSNVTFFEELGVNTLRLYNVNPTSKLYVDKYKSIEPEIIETIGPEHRPFLDMAHQYGFKVIFPILSDESTLFGNPKERLERWIQTQIEEVGDHPALLMW